MMILITSKTEEPTNAVKKEIDDYFNEYHPTKAELEEVKFWFDNYGYALMPRRVGIYFKKNGFKVRLEPGYSQCKIYYKEF